MDAIKARSQRIEASKHHASRWDGFRNLQVTSTSPPTRTPSPMLSDVSQSISGAVSPLPSPLMGAQLEIEPPSTPGTKTNAFFGSPWKLLIPKPATPPKVKKTSTDVHDSAPFDIPHHDEKPPPAAPRSQTINFFNTSSKHIPSPPPSIRQFSPDEKPDSTAAALRLQLARLSPSRVQQPLLPLVMNEESTDLYRSHSRSSSHSSNSHGYGFSKPARDFVYWTPESSDLSRSSSRSSVSGIRRDFAFTPINPSSSYSPSNHTVSYRSLGQDRSPGHREFCPN